MPTTYNRLIGQGLCVCESIRDCYVDICCRPTYYRPSG